MKGSHFLLPRLHLELNGAAHTLPRQVFSPENPCMIIILNPTAA